MGGGGAFPSFAFLSSSGNRRAAKRRKTTRDRVDHQRHQHRRAQVAERDAEAADGVRAERQADEGDDQQVGRRRRWRARAAAMRSCTVEAPGPIHSDGAALASTASARRAAIDLGRAASDDERQRQQRGGDADVAGAPRRATRRQRSAQRPPSVTPSQPGRGRAAAEDQTGVGLADAAHADEVRRHPEADAVAGEGEQREAERGVAQRRACGRSSRRRRGRAAPAPAPRRPPRRCRSPSAIHCAGVPSTAISAAAHSAMPDGAAEVEREHAARRRDADAGARA